MVNLKYDLVNQSHSNTIKLVAKRIKKFVEINDNIPNSDKIITRFHSENIAPISIEAYLKRIYKYTYCGNDCFLSVLVYFHRMSQIQNYIPPFPSSYKKNRKPFIINSYNIHRLLISAIIVAIKFNSDIYFNNSHYAKVGGLPTQELNNLEVDFLILNNYDLHVSVEEMQYTGDCLLNNSFPDPVVINGVKYMDLLSQPVFFNQSINHFVLSDIDNYNKLKKLNGSNNPCLRYSKSYDVLKTKDKINSGSGGGGGIFGYTKYINKIRRKSNNENSYPNENILNKKNYNSINSYEFDESYIEERFKEFFNSNNQLSENSMLKYRKSYDTFKDTYIKEHLMKERQMNNYFNKDQTPNYLAMNGVIVNSSSGSSSIVEEKKSKKKKKSFLKRKSSSFKLKSKESNVSLKNNFFNSNSYVEEGTGIINDYTKANYRSEENDLGSQYSNNYSYSYVSEGKPTTTTTVKTTKKEKDYTNTSSFMNEEKNSYRHSSKLISSEVKRNINDDGDFTSASSTTNFFNHGSKNMEKRSTQLNNSNEKNESYNNHMNSNMENQGQHSHDHNRHSYSHSRSHSRSHSNGMNTFKKNDSNGSDSKQNSQNKIHRLSHKLSSSLSNILSHNRSKSTKALNSPTSTPDNNQSNFLDSKGNGNVQSSKKEKNDKERSNYLNKDLPTLEGKNLKSKSSQPRLIITPSSSSSISMPEPQETNQKIEMLNSFYDDVSKIIQRNKEKKKIDYGKMLNDINIDDGNIDDTLNQITQIYNNYTSSNENNDDQNASFVNQNIQNDSLASSIKKSSSRHSNFDKTTSRNLKGKKSKSKIFQNDHEEKKILDGDNKKDKDDNDYEVIDSFTKDDSMSSKNLRYSFHLDTSNNNIIYDNKNERKIKEMLPKKSSKKSSKKNIKSSSNNKCEEKIAATTTNVNRSMKRKSYRDLWTGKKSNNLDYENEKNSLEQKEKNVNNEYEEYLKKMMALQSTSPSSSANLTNKFLSSSLASSPKASKISRHQNSLLLSSKNANKKEKQRKVSNDSLSLYNNDDSYSFDISSKNNLKKLENKPTQQNNVDDGSLYDRKENNKKDKILEEDFNEFEYYENSAYYASENNNNDAINISSKTTKTKKDLKSNIEKTEEPKEVLSSKKNNKKNDTININLKVINNNEIYSKNLKISKNEINENTKNQINAKNFNEKKNYEINNSFYGNELITNDDDIFIKNENSINKNINDNINRKNSSKINDEKDEKDEIVNINKETKKSNQKKYLNGKNKEIKKKLSSDIELQLPSIKDFLEKQNETIQATQSISEAINDFPKHKNHKISSHNDSEVIHSNKTDDETIDNVYHSSVTSSFASSYSYSLSEKSKESSTQKNFENDKYENTDYDNNQILDEYLNCIPSSPENARKSLDYLNRVYTNDKRGRGLSNIIEDDDYQKQQQQVIVTTITTTSPTLTTLKIYN